jgi:uncharacterized small protein (DUF1192 family)
MNADSYSLYIPTINKKYSIETIIKTFWNFLLGQIDRVDFVPIMKKYNEELVEDNKFQQAFIYIRPSTKWSSFLTEAMDETGSFRFYPHQERRSNYQVFPAQPLPGSMLQGKYSEYWLLLKNKNPVPYATTTLNIHQLVHNNSLLETKVVEMEQEISNLKEEIARLKEDNMERSTSCSTTEEENNCVVSPFENISRMMDERAGLVNDDTTDYDEYLSKIDDYDREREEEEKSLVYDDNGEMTPRGRKPMPLTFNCLLSKE